LGVYNRIAAQHYAFRWATSRNPKFHDYSSHARGGGGGGDCTNFVSQVLLAGGWTMTGGFRHDPTSWFANDDHDSNSWASAQWFYWFLKTSNRVEPCDRGDLEIGDIAMLQAPDFNDPDHAMVVTSKPPGGEIYVSYHTIDQLNHPLSEIEGRYSPETKYFYWKVQDAFTDRSPPVLMNYFAM
jgi:hypothetical protein